MNYVGKLLSNFKGFYNDINSATLTGAIDVLIVRQQDGSYLCSPFHVRFGKMGVLRAREKIVDMEINDEPVDLHMKLGEAGEAFFVQKAKESADQIPAHLATSPIPSEIYRMKLGLEELHRQQEEEQRHQSQWQLEAEEEPPQLPWQPEAQEEGNQLPWEPGTQEKLDLQVKDDDHLPVERPRSRSVTPLGTRSGVGTQTTTPPPCMPKDDSTNSISSATLPKKDSQTSLYHSVHTSFDHGSDEEKKTGDEKRDSPQLQKEKQKNSSSGSEDDKKSDMATQTEITGEEVATKTKSCSVSVRRASSDDGTISSPPTSISMPCVKIDMAQELSQTNSLPKDISPTNSKKQLTVKKKRRKKIERKRREMFNVDEANEGDNSSVDGQTDEMLFDMDLSGEESSLDMSMSRTVSMPIIEDHRRHMVGEWASSQRASAFHPFSDGDITPIMSPIGTRPPSPKSDTEYETYQQFDAVSQTLLTGDDFSTIDEVKWKWGELPESTPIKNVEEVKPEKEAHDVSSQGGLFSFMRKTKKMRHQPEQEGIYLDDLNLDEMDPEVVALYLNHPKGPRTNHMLTIKDEDNESGRGASLPQSPVSHEHTHTEETHHPIPTQPLSQPQFQDVSMSLCGGLKEADGCIAPEKFLQFLVTYDDFCKNPDILSNPNLVVRIGDKHYNWQIAGPMIMALVAFQQPLSQHAADNLIKQHMPKKDRRRGWIFWRTTDESSSPAQKSEITSPPSSAPSSAPNSPEKNKDLQKRSIDHQKDDGFTSDEDLEYSHNQMCKETHIDMDFEGLPANYRKSLKLTSEQIEKLNLKDGVNKAAFSVTTQYQGTTRCTSSIYLWNWDDRIIVSDIDGTITKSDVLGQLLPMVGKDWSQAGIANLYSMIHRNGYKFLYLSARAIGQSKITRDYLHSIRQGEVSLPDGPLLLSPSSLISAFHREVIERKPEEFKISCLRDISVLFPNTRNPFYAGYGNKINDVWAYRAVGIPISRIFTVNHRGELKLELMHVFQSSYTELSDIVDHLFPPLVQQDDVDGSAVVSGKIQSGNFHAPDQFSDCTYWKEPLPSLELDELEQFKVQEDSRR